MTAPYEPPATEPAPTPRREGRRKRRRQRDDVMVPTMEFESYYGRNIVKPAPWKAEIPAYLFLGGLAAGTGLLASGGEMTGRAELQRNARLVSLAALSGSTAVLVKDLGKPSRFLNMMRTVKLTSPMSIGTWILTGFGGFTGIAAATEVAKMVLPRPAKAELAFILPAATRVSSWGAGAFAAPLAAYTAVLLSDTATPTWHEAYRQLPFVFVGSALAASGGAAMITTSVDECGPARNVAVGGAVVDLVADAIMERHLGMLAEPMHEGRAGAYLRAAKVLTVAGAALTLIGGRRRPVAALAGAALLAGSACTRFGIFEAGIASAKDPRYTVEPQKARLAARREQQRQEAS